MRVDTGRVLFEENMNAYISTIILGARSVIILANDDRTFSRKIGNHYCLTSHTFKEMTIFNYLMSISRTVLVIGRDELNGLYCVMLSTNRVCVILD